ncbi:hypothetical protein CsSME_00004120 [Camellia sinensis var. sinensis]
MSIAFVVTSVANCCRPRSSPPPLALRVTDDRLLLDRLTAGRFGKFLFVFSLLSLSLCYLLLSPSLSSIHLVEDGL